MFGGGYFGGPGAPPTGPPGAGYGPPQGYAQGPPAGPPGSGYGPPQGYAQGTPPPPGPPVQQGFFYMGIPVPPPPPHAPLPAFPGMDIEGRCERIYKSMRGLGTNDSVLIGELCTMHDPFLIDAVRNGYKQYRGKDLMKAVEGDTSGWYEAVLRWQVYGPVLGDVVHLRRGMAGAGTQESVLTEILIGRSNGDIHLLKAAYQAHLGRNLEEDVASELSFKTKRMFTQALTGARDEMAPVIPQQVDHWVHELHHAMRGPGTKEDVILHVLVPRNDSQLVAIAARYQQKHHKLLSDAIKGDLDGHMEQAVLHLVLGAEDPAGVQGFGIQRDANLIHKAMKQDAGTKDRDLVRRVCRASFHRVRFQSLKQLYQQLHGHSLVHHIKRDTTGNYEKSLVTVVETA